MLSQNNISVCFTTDQFKKYADERSTVVIIDILRATSVISTAFELGIEAVIPVQTVKEALTYKNKENHIIAAERNTLKIKGFDYGNSPYHYINSDIKGKTLVLTTTNGTKAIHLAKSHKVITASFLNINIVAKYLQEDNNDIIILCSGWKGMFNLEDSIFAGAICEKLLESDKFSSKCDSMLAAIELYGSGRGNLFNYLSNSAYRNRNNSDSVIKDTHFCLNPTIKSNIIPIFTDGKLIKLKGY
ncbi:MAG: 2-phosphosulfolactate phosphatase [Flavobacteriales bacterium]|nr:2-phosphosulfolactate phosphatase [Flavobacteriales bacterium]